MLGTATPPGPVPSAPTPCTPPFPGKTPPLTDLTATLDALVLAEPAETLLPAHLTIKLDREPEANFGYLHIPDLPAILDPPTLPPKRTAAPPAALQVTLTEHTRVLDPESAPDPPTHPPQALCATVQSRTLLTGPDALAPVYELCLAAASPETTWTWRPGDSFGVFAPNDLRLAVTVASLLRTDPPLLVHSSTLWRSRSVHLDVACAFDLKTPFPVSSEASHWDILDLLRTQFDLVAFPKKSLLLALADMSTDTHTRHVLHFLCSTQGAASYRALSAKYTLLHVLYSVHAHLTTELRLALLLPHLSPLRPRYYSHTSPTFARCMFNVVSRTIPGSTTPWVGQCSGYLAARCPGDTLWVIPHPTRVFHPPTTPTAPLVMIGTGTGLAPFLSFLPPPLTDAPPRRVLYQGCRHPHWDALYASELAAAVSAGHLAQHAVAYSRLDGPTEPRARYVQDLLTRDAAHLVDTMCVQQGHLYVCGDVHKMGKPMQMFLDELFATHAGVKGFVKRLIQEGRYHQELW